MVAIAMNEPSLAHVPALERILASNSATNLTRAGWCRGIRVSSADDRRQLRHSGRRPSSAVGRSRGHQGDEDRARQDLQPGRRHPGGAGGQRPGGGGGDPQRPDRRDRRGRRRGSRSLGGAERRRVLPGHQHRHDPRRERGVLRRVAALGGARARDPEPRHRARRARLVGRDQSLHGGGGRRPLELLPALGWDVPARHRRARHPAAAHVPVRLPLLLLREPVPVPGLRHERRRHQPGLRHVRRRRRRRGRRRPTLHQPPGRAAGRRRGRHGEAGRRRRARRGRRERLAHQGRRLPARRQRPQRGRLQPPAREEDPGLQRRRHAQAPRGLHPHLHLRPLQRGS
jgi:hypothetical protein